MAILAADKVFVDPKEEITFLIERVLASERERVAIVVPQSSLILSSPISVGILQREIYKSKKVSVMVTEDDYGINIAQKVGWVVVPKLSQITGDLWDVAISKKEKYIEGMNLRRKRLETGESFDSAQDDQEQMTNEAELDVDLDNEDDIDSSDLPEDLEPEKEVAIEGESDLDESLEGVKVEPEEVVDIDTGKELDAKNEAEQEMVNSFKKPRREAKVIDLDGIQVLAGGDIKSFNARPNNVKISDDINDFNDENMDSNDEGRRIVRPKGATSSSFTGKDFTKVVTKDTSFGGFFKNLFQPSLRDSELGGDDSLMLQRRKKIIIGAVIGIVIFLMLFVVVSASNFSSVDVSVKFKQEDISADASILVDPNITEASFDPVTIPSEVLSVEKISMSRTGEATGTGRKGEKAKGFVQLFNTREEVINLPAGTLIKSVASNREYALVSAITLQAAEISSNTVNAYTVDNVAIEAKDIGTEYNVDFSSQTYRFTVGAYDVRDVSAILESDLEGGTVTEFTSVSKENIDKLKEQMLPDLEAQAESKLRSQIPSGSTLLQETIEFKETAVTSTPKENEEAKDKNFSLTVEISATGYAVKNSDLKAAAENVLLNSDDIESNDNLVVGDLKTPEIVKVEKSGDTNYVLTVSTQGAVGVELTEDQIKDEVAGKTLDEAYDFFENIEDIEEYTLRYSPGYVPEFLKRIPSDRGRISVRIR